MAPKCSITLPLTFQLIFLYRLLKIPMNTPPITSQILLYSTLNTEAPQLEIFFINIKIQFLFPSLFLLGGHNTISFFLLFDRTGIWTQGLTLAMQAFYHLSHTPNPTFLSFSFLPFLVVLEFELRGLRDRCFTTLATPPAPHTFFYNKKWLPFERKITYSA
jgi:hypothetical protein